MNRYWSRLVNDLQPYTPGEQPRIANLVKLNTNENPYPPTPRAVEAITQATGDALRLYPDPTAAALVQSIANFHGVQPQQVFVGNGSDEVLAHVFAALLKHPKPLWMPDISYSFYPTYCKLFGIDYRLVPLDAQFRIQPEDYWPSEAGAAGGIIFANPNAPTGCALTLAEIEPIVTRNPQAVVVIDEAYVDFGAESAVSLVNKYSNVLVVHTLSKSRSLAGLRVGYAIGHEELIEALVRVKDSFNSYPLDKLAQCGAIAAIEDRDYFQATCQKVMATRERLIQSLTALGFEVLPSAANFVFARHSHMGGATLAAALRERAILVRHFNKPRISDFLRISIGTEQETDALLSALQAIVPV